MKLPIRKRFIFLILVILLALVFALGPKPDYPPIEAHISPLKIPLSELDAYIQQKESAFPLKEDNQARVVWADSIPQKTPYSIVFVHGFSASPMVGNPVLPEVAERYGCNVYLTRLSGHGIDDTESFKSISPKDLVDSVKEAIAIGNLIGEKTIIMASSTGATLSTYLAAHNPSTVDALMFYAPLISLADPSGQLLSYPWGLQIIRKINGNNYHRFKQIPAGVEKYWTTQYRLEGLVAVQHLLDETMTPSVFERIQQPLFVSYYYKDEENQDKVVSVEAIKTFFNSVSTPDDQKVLAEFSEAGGHVLLSDLQAKNLDEARKETFKFLDKLLLNK